MPSTLIRNATILPMDDRMTVLDGDVALQDGRIAAVGVIPDGRYDRTIDAAGGYVLPGFVQTHVHLCQTLFRGLADDMPLLEWLQRRVWPLEAAHTRATLAASVQVAAAELLRTGTTTVLTMETVHDTDVVFEALSDTGMRAIVGKCMMDSADGVPARLREDTRRSIDESAALIKRWRGTAGGRLGAAFAPRFAVSCSRDLLEAVAHLSVAEGVLVHTHASESREEVAVVRGQSGGRGNIEYLAEVGLAAPHLCAAHCVWVDAAEQALLAERGVQVLHCPGSNLKLGSGIAPVAAMRQQGIAVSLGCDGAACNNRLDMFDEMRLAATLQAVRAGPGALPAKDVLGMATRGGAAAVGLAGEIGSIEPGKRADLIVVRREVPHLSAAGDPWSALVYAARGSDVRYVLVDGELLVEDGALTRVDTRHLARLAREAAGSLVRAAGI